MSPANAAGSTASVRAHLLELLAPIVENAGYYLEDIAVTGAGRRSLVRVSVDTIEGPPGSEDGVAPGNGAVGAEGVAAGEGGIDLDGVALVSRAISEAMDAEDGAFTGPYVLEVGSPGVDRPLTEQRHWRRAVGRLVQLQVDGRAVTGRVIATADNGITLEVDGAPREYAWAELGSGRVQVEFNRPGGNENEED